MHHGIIQQQKHASSQAILAGGIHFFYLECDDLLYQTAACAQLY
jgi:hypothetical protein